jgi:hypothetical protein
MHASTGATTGPAYVRLGIGLTAQAPWLYVAISVVYALPALLAAWLVYANASPQPWETAVIFILPWMTLVLGTVVVMVAVGAHAHGHGLTFGQATWRALPHVPRYVWTNAHTSLVFWIPITALLTLKQWQAELLPTHEQIQIVWWIAIGMLALAIHTRTLLAPFLAIHGDLPATLAALEAWRLSGKAFAACFGTLIAGSLPLALPLALLVVAVLLNQPDDVRRALEPALPNLAYAGIQIIRPLLIPATYLLFVDLWTAEQQRRARVGEPAVPAFAQMLLALTRPLPRLTPKA